MFTFVCVTLSLSLVLLNVHCDLPTVRQTTNGPVEGIEVTSSLGQKYYAFKSIPYAEPPITGTDPYTGELVDRRFKAPEPLKRKWTDNLNAKEESGAACIPATSVNPVNLDESEDCLFLRIYVPAGGAQKKTVLMVFHGFGFTEGNYRDLLHGPDFLLAADNIVVVTQYRLNIFGFLNLDTPEYSGNMGLKDQQMAMKFVYENIENFPGNKDEILILGHSAGGASVTYHLLNEESRKYFTRAYPFGGSAFDYFAHSELNHWNRMRECSNTDDENSVMEYLKTSDADDLAECHYRTEWGKTLKPEWGPTIEKPNAKMPFITQSPEEIYKSGKDLAKDVLFSFESQETLTFDIGLTKETEPLIRSDWKETNIHLPFDDLNADVHPNEFRDALEKLRIAYYTNATDISDANIALMSDLNFGDGILKNVIFQAMANTRSADKSQHKNTFYFRYSVNNALNVIKFIMDTPYKGAAHMDDLCFMMHCHLLDQFNFYDKYLEDKNSPEFKSIMRFVTIITNFARTGNPSIKGDTPFKPCTSDEIFCQDITKNPISSVMDNMKEQLHYDTWREIEQSYRKLMEQTKN